MKRQRAETTSAERRSKAEGKRTVVQHVTNNYTTINNYFAPAQPNPQTAPEPEGDACLFPKGERGHNRSVKWGKHTRSYRGSHVTRDNKLMAGCTACTNDWQQMRRFAPQESNKNSRRLPAFKQATSDLEAAVDGRDLPAAREARERVEEKRSTVCVKCQRDIGYLPPRAEGVQGVL
jgi:hypothetical protein